MARRRSSWRSQAPLAEVCALEFPIYTRHLPGHCATPIRVGSVREGDHILIAVLEHVHGCAVCAVRLPPSVHHNPEAGEACGQPTGNGWFVTRRLKRATACGTGMGKLLRGGSVPYRLTRLARERLRLYFPVPIKKRLCAGA